MPLARATQAAVANETWWVCPNKHRIREDLLARLQ